MNIEDARTALRSGCDEAMRKEGFTYLRRRDAYVREFEGGLQLVCLRLLVVAGVVRLEFSAAVRFEEIENEYHRALGTAARFAKLTNTLWIPGEALTGWPIGACHPRLRDSTDIDQAIHRVLAFVEGYALNYFASHETLESLSSELNTQPSEPTPHCAPPARAFYGVIAARKLGLADFEVLVDGHRAALSGIDRGYHNAKFDGLVEELRRQLDLD